MLIRTGTLQLVSNQRFNRVTAVVAIAGMMTAGACSTPKDDRPAPRSPSANKVASGSCSLVPGSVVSDATGVRVEAHQTGTVSCVFEKSGTDQPVAIISVAPGTANLGNPVPDGTSPSAQDSGSTGAEWRQSALPGGVRLGAHRRGWTVTVDVSAPSKDPAAAATELMDATTSRLPKAPTD